MFTAPETGVFSDRAACDHRAGVNRREAVFLLGSTIASLASFCEPAVADAQSLIVKAPTASVVDLPDYKPWPPHRPSARHTFPERFMSRFRNEPARLLMSTLEDHLQNLMYQEVYHFTCPTGLVFMLPFELLRADRVSIPEDRFDVDSNGRPKIDGFDRARAAFVRTVSFILTADPPSVGPHPTLFSKQFAKLRSGAKALDPNLKTPLISLRHQLRAFIYEWALPRGSGDATFVRESKLYGWEHLVKMRIMSEADRD